MKVVNLISSVASWYWYCLMFKAEISILYQKWKYNSGLALVSKFYPRNSGLVRLCTFHLHSTIFFCFWLTTEWTQPSQNCTYEGQKKTLVHRLQNIWKITLTTSSKVFLASSTATMYLDLGLSSIIFWIRLGKEKGHSLGLKKYAKNNK